MPGGSIAVASDHAGFDLKEMLKRDLQEAGHEVLDLGTHSTASVDYPDFGKAMGDAIASGKAERGVLVCGSGIGISIAANRNPKVRAVLAHDVTSARLSREHNDANVIAFGQRLTGIEVAREALKVFLATKFEGGRHAGRVDKLSKG
ncbi:ribose 5-phosphate isomerase B [Reyranella sp.]|jgi:ribose 5-phosphate isomerase B|uniref:ribose 5-phosphate isomerase B n=1 Tax=Reyranella sp. TaxID=1929291 RepID=UPI000BC69CAC|nr:ribose 5-phosphate isomerase B [Reyranella sp.]OYY44111.1 MAG: ribose 5-phosphate isomerase B [Rhodospirillales bacterium 35-66-84]OYZ94787.1 MAG: ribose 5-phosphate isomerase B [Rhodospirillales bacterium 24-66-33]OZB26138.1 MAG: ribose 5-phosphate isomerase B [Rhodospirillales bacterium 39-66-50]HQS15158.1 ribose 5-phosphate isomerase B [Reyranella sp.]HQT10967.1 ribose 5-phosphate isomerase B [Reyranella sp.]